MAKLHPTIEQHRERANRNGISRWKVRVERRWRRIELQEYRKRLYLVGCLYSGLNRVLEFEEPLPRIIEKCGDVIE